MICRSRSLTGASGCDAPPEGRCRLPANALDLLPALVRDAQDAIIYWSHGAELLYGFTSEEALGHSSQELLQTQCSEPREQVQAGLRLGKAWQGKVSQTRKDGARIVVTSQWVPCVDPQTGASTTIEISVGSNEPKAAEEAHNRLAAIVESSEDAIISKSLEGIITSWNSAAERLFGYRAEEVLGLPMELITPADRRAEAAIMLERVRAGEHIEPFDTVRLTKEGRRLDVSLTMSPVRDEAGTIVGVSKIVRDISERKRAEEAARLAREAAHRRQIEKREQILSAMMEHIRLGIAIADAPGVTIRMVSRHGRNLLQKPKEQIVGVPAEQHPAAFAFFHADGTRARPEEMPLTRATLHGEVIKGEEWVVARRDGVRIPILCTAAPIRDQKNRIIGGVLGWQDLSRRKQAESALHKAQAELQAHAEALEKTVTERTAKLRDLVAELRAFSYSVSHDLRAPIRAIRGFAEIALVRNAGTLAPFTVELLRKIVSAAASAEGLIQDILALSRLSRQPPQLAPVQLEALLREVIEERPEIQSSGAEIAIHSPLAPVLGDGSSLRQCLTNLLGNAVKYVAPGMRPRIQVRTELRLGPSDGKAAWSGATAGQGEPSAEASDGLLEAAAPASVRPSGPLEGIAFVRLWVEDNGIGIPPEEQSKVFDLFHRAHHQETYEGSGLGLAIVRKAVERMGGRVGVESAPGVGSQFWIELPQAPGASP